MAIAHLPCLPKKRLASETLSLRLQFRDTVAALSPREKRIMELRYLRGKTQMEVAQEIGISQAQVSRLEKGALQQFHTGG